MMGPETPVSPVAQAPPDRPTVDLETWAKQGLALLFSDRRLDPAEQEILRDFFEEVALRAQASGGIGAGAPQSPDGPGQLPPSPMQMNAEGAEDFGAGQGEPMETEGAY